MATRAQRVWPTALVACVLAAGSTVLGQRPSIRDLDWLVGEWSFTDEQINGDYRETGSRSCAYALGGDYIRCESRGRDHRGRERSYVWYFNYNSVESRFEITSLFQDNPRKFLYSATLHDEGRRLEIRFGSWEGDGLKVEGGASVVYNGRDQYVWANARFRDVVTRR